MMLRDTSELRQPLAKEAMAVLTGVRVSITDDVGIGVGDGQVAVHSVLFFDIFVDRIAIRTENNTAIAVGCDFFVGLL